MNKLCRRDLLTSLFASLFGATKVLSQPDDQQPDKGPDIPDDAKPSKAQLLQHIAELTTRITNLQETVLRDMRNMANLMIPDPNLQKVLYERLEAEQNNKYLLIKTATIDLINQWGAFTTHCVALLKKHNIDINEGAGS
jgi:hypothetical protein